MGPAPGHSSYHVRMRIAVFAALLATALPVLAVEDRACDAYIQLAALYELRSGELAHRSGSIDDAVDRKVNELREPLGGGDYRWVRWVKPSGEGPVDKDVNTVRAKNGTSSDSLEASGRHAFGVRVSIPRKRSLLNANNAVYVGTVQVHYEINGRAHDKSEAINAWMNPDTSRTIDLGGIADSVDVTMNASTAKPGEAIAEIHFRQAVMEDDPDNPAYMAIGSLLRVREAYDERGELDSEIARVETRMFPGSTPLPLLEIISDLRRADDLMRSKKTDEQEEGDKLLHATLRRLR
jgi:hypothetical protein